MAAARNEAILAEHARVYDGEGSQALRTAFRGQFAARAQARAQRPSQTPNPTARLTPARGVPATAATHVSSYPGGVRPIWVLLFGIGVGWLVTAGHVVPSAESSQLNGVASLRKTPLAKVAESAQTPHHPLDWTGGGRMRTDGSAKPVVASYPGLGFKSVTKTSANKGSSERERRCTKNADAGSPARNATPRANADVPIDAANLPAFLHTWWNSTHGAASLASSLLKSCVVYCLSFISTSWTALLGDDERGTLNELGSNLATKTHPIGAADVLGFTNCPRLRLARDLLFGDGWISNFVGVVEFVEDDGGASLVAVSNADANTNASKDDSPAAKETPQKKKKEMRLKTIALTLFLICPGAIFALRAHELWGVDSTKGLLGCLFGFALVVMWCQGQLELFSRWRECPKRARRRRIRRDLRRLADIQRETGWSRDRAPRYPLTGSALLKDELRHGLGDFYHSAAFRYTISRGVSPGIARAVMLEVLGSALSLTTWRYFPKSLAEIIRNVFLLLGALFLPLFRLVYRAWYVTANTRGSKRWFDFQTWKVHHQQTGRESGQTRGDRDAQNRVESERDEETLNDFANRFAPIGYTGADRFASSDDNSWQPIHLLEGGFGFDANFGMDTDEALVGDGVDVDGDGDAAFGADEVEVTNGTGPPRSPTGVPIVASRPTSQRTDDATPRSASSSHSCHWPSPVQIPEWLDDAKAPAHFKCPITLCIIREPAVTPAGISYERNALMQWLEQTHTEPSTKRRLKRSRVVPNLTLRGMIEDWLSDRRAERRERLARKATMARKADSGKTTGEDDTETDGVNQVNPVSLSQPSTSTHQGVGVGLPQENSRLHRPGLPARAGAVSQDTRDELRRARQVMYAALKRRASSGMSAEETRWADVSAGRQSDGSEGFAGFAGFAGFGPEGTGVSQELLAAEQEDGDSVLDTTVADADDREGSNRTSDLQATQIDAQATLLLEDLDEDPYL